MKKSYGPPPLPLPPLPPPLRQLPSPPPLPLQELLLVLLVGLALLHHGTGPLLATAIIRKKPNRNLTALWSRRGGGGERLARSGAGRGIEGSR